MDRQKGLPNSFSPVTSTTVRINSKNLLTTIFHNKNEQQISTSLYQKKNFSGVYMNYNSSLPLNYKNGLIHTLLFRAFNICADCNTFHNEVQCLKLIWQKNSFPHFFIDSCTKRILDKLFTTRKTSNSISDKKRNLYLYRILGENFISKQKATNWNF